MPKGNQVYSRQCFWIWYLEREKRKVRAIRGKKRSLNKTCSPTQWLGFLNDVGNVGKATCFCFSWAPHRHRFIFHFPWWWHYFIPSLLIELFNCLRKVPPWVWLLCIFILPYWWDELAVLFELVFSHEFSKVWWLDDAASAFYIFTYRNFGIICFPKLTPPTIKPSCSDNAAQSNKKLLLCKGANSHPSYFGVFYTNSFIKLRAWPSSPM